MQNKNANKIRIQEIFYILCTCMAMLIIYLPSWRIHYDLPTIAMIGVIYGLLFFRHISKVLPGVIVPIVAYGLINFFVTRPGNFKMGFLHTSMGLWIWVFPFLIGLEMMMRKNLKVVKYVLLFNFILFLIIIKATFQAMVESPNIMRQMTAISSTDETFRLEALNNNVGGFAIAYGTGALLIICTTILCVIKPRGVNLLISWGLLVISFMLVVSAQFTTLLILCGGGVVYIVWQNSRNILTKTITIIVGILLTICSQVIFEWILLYYQDTTTGNHLLDVYNSIYLGQQYESYRNDFLMDSIRLFWENPIWGHDLENNAANAAIARHGHSTFFGIGSGTGLIGLVCFYGAIWRAFEPIYKFFGMERKRFFTSLILYVFLLSIFNPIESDIISYMIGFSIPLFIFYIYESEREKVKTVA